MPLSEQEQRLLDEMERSLYHGDADFAASVGRVRTGSGYGAVIGGILLAVGGVALLLGGVVAHSWFVGVLGFAAMFIGVLAAIGISGRRRALPGAGRGGAAAAPRAGLMDRLAARWERRRQG